MNNDKRVKASYLYYVTRLIGKLWKDEGTKMEFTKEELTLIYGMLQDEMFECERNIKFYKSIDVDCAFYEIRLDKIKPSIDKILTQIVMIERNENGGNTTLDL